MILWFLRSAKHRLLATGLTIFDFCVNMNYSGRRTKYQLDASAVTQCISRVGKSSVNNFLSLAQLINKKEHEDMVESKTNAISNLQRLKERRKQLINKVEVVSADIRSHQDCRLKSRLLSTLISIKKTMQRL